MNKNFLKSILIGAVVFTSLFSFLSSTSYAATTPGGGSQSGTYVELPIKFVRNAPTMKTSVPCNSVDTIPHCVDVTAGIGMYYYSGTTHSPERSNIGNSQQITVTNTKTKAVTYTSNYIITTTTNGSFGTQAAIRIYGLSSGTYTMSFSYLDANSSDIKSVISQADYYCTKYPSGGLTVQGPAEKGKEKGFDIARNLVNGCQRYDSEPFLPAAQEVVIDAFTFNAGSMTPKVLSAITISAPDPELASSDPSGKKPKVDDCPIDPQQDFRWASCGLWRLGSSAVSKVDAVIQNFLFTPTSQVFSPQMKTAWNSFRTLGVSLILIAGLVMVISQAAGMEIFDAYTVRKVLPRLLIAAIGISLSWPLLQFGVTLFNDLGLWAHDLILAPFGSGALNNSGSMILASLFVVGAGAAYAAFSLDTMATLSLIFTIILALLIGLLVLAIRQLAILVCVIFAPLAIACYILPGTQKVWEFWKNTLLTALIMFPIIMAFIAAGKAFAYVAGSTNSTEMHLLSVIVYFAPYFLLPFAFKLAGGLMSTVFSIANDKSRGLFDRGKKFRKERGALVRQKTKAGVRFDGGTPENFRGKLNHGLQTAALLPSSRFNPRRAKGRIGRARDDMAFNRAMEGLEKDANMAAIAPDDSMLDAGLQSHGDEKALRQTFERKYDSKFGQDQAGRRAYRKKVEEDTAAVSNAIRSMGWESFEIAATVAKPGTKTGYAPSEDDPRPGNTQMLGAINAASHGSEALAGRMLGAARSMAGRAGRDDLTPSFGAAIGELQKVMRGQGAVDESKLVLDVFENKDLSSLGRGDSRSVDSIAKTVEQRIKTLSANGSRSPDESRELGRLTAALENWKSNGVYIPSARLSAITQAVENTTVERGNVRYEVETTPERRRIDESKGALDAPDVVRGYREQALNPARNIEDQRMHDIFEREQQAQQEQQNRQNRPGA